jgi:hypothetical protein
MMCVPALMITLPSAGVQVCKSEERDNDPYPVAPFMSLIDPAEDRPRSRISSKEVPGRLSRAANPVEIERESPGMQRGGFPMILAMRCYFYPEKAA